MLSVSTLRCENRMLSVSTSVQLLVQDVKCKYVKVLKEMR